MVICLERGADLHTAPRLMPLPLTVSCFSKIQIGFTFLVLAHLGSPGKGPLNGCVYAHRAGVFNLWFTDPQGASKGSAVNPRKTGDPSHFNFLLSKNTGRINVVGTGYNVQN